MIEASAEQLAIGIFLSLEITLGIYLGFLEWQRKRLTKNAKIKKQVLISLSTIPPQYIAYLLMAPLWAVLYQIIGNHSLFHWEYSWAAIPFAFIACDFSYYCEHRLAHKSTFLWRLYHGTHHTGTSYNIPLAYRVNGLNQLIAPLFYLPWVLLGVEPLLVISFQLIVFHYQAWLHTESIDRLPTFDFLMNSPANHRIHHSKYHEANFGGVFMIWDHLFKTYHSPREDLAYGIKHKENDDSYSGIYLNL